MRGVPIEQLEQALHPEWEEKQLAWQGALEGDMEEYERFLQVSWGTCRKDYERFLQVSELGHL